MKLSGWLLLSTALGAVAVAQTVSVTPATTTYPTAGGSVTFNVTLSYTGEMSSVGLQIESVPAGWAFGTAGGASPPQVKPSAGETAGFGFAYTTVPGSPASFNFTATCSAGLSGTQTFSGISAIFRYLENGVSRQVIATAPSVALTPGSGGGGGATAPVITQQPVGATLNLGDTLTLTVVASGSTPLSYQWKRDGTALSGATGSSLVLPLVTASAAGTYTVVVTNSAGTATSNGAVVTVQSTAATAPQITTQPVSATVAVGGNVVLVVGASGTAPLSYQWRKDGVTIAGATAATLALANVQTTATGSYSVIVTNSAGSATSGAAVISVQASSTGVAPQIVTQPVGQAVAAGSSVILSVSATGTAPLSYQWRKDGAAIAAATAATLTLANVQGAAAGNYSVVVTNTAGSATSNAAVITVQTTGASGLPQITGQPTGQTVAPGASVTFNVAANGTSPLSYQWRKDGVAIAGATSPTLTLSNVQSSAAGSYSAVVTNPAGTATSGIAVLTVRSAGVVAGTYVGSFGGNGGDFALLVRPDRTGVFVGYARVLRVAVVSRNVVVEADGRFSAEEPRAASPRALSDLTPSVAAMDGSLRLSGAIAADGTLTGAVPALDLSFSAPAAVVSGPASTVAGFYQSGAAGSSAASYAIFSPGGEATVVVVEGTKSDGGRGTVDTSGSFSVTTADSARLSGAVRTDRVITTTFAPASGPAVTFVGTNAEARGNIERLANLSTRSRTGTATDSLIAGFVVSGTAAKPVLVRGIGPTLVEFGVAGALNAARLEVFRGASSVAVGNNWGESTTNADSLAEAATRVGAFPLARTSRDAVLLLNLEPGAYTAVVTGQGGATGVALVEVYDATPGAIPPAQRMVNLATRSGTGAGEDLLIAGFVITGELPKRVLVRGAGPALAQFGVTGVLSRPELSVLSGGTVLARNSGWGDAADVAAITAAAAQVGAFDFPVASPDAAIVINLAPGAYTAQLGGVGGSSGQALIEIYEVP